MLQKMRDNTQSIGFKILVGLIIFVLAVFGFGTFDLFANNDAEVASVGSQEITESMLARETERTRIRTLAQMGEAADPALIDVVALRSQSLDQLINQAVLVETIDQLHVVTAPSTVDKSLIENPSFQTDGKFDQDLYVRLLQQYGYTPVSFRDQVTKEMAINQLQTAIAESSTVPRWQLREFAALMNQRRDLAWLSLTETGFVSRVELAEEDIEAYYADNRLGYQTDDTVDLDYVILTSQSLAGDPSIDISEEDLQQAFETDLKALADSEQRTSSHILLGITQARDDAATLEAINGLREQLVAGGDFAALAKEHSEDPGSAASGGDLGAAGRGIFDPAFEAALFALQEGELSQPVKSQFGYHLIKLVSIQKPVETTFEARRDEIETRLREERAKDLFVDKVREMDSLAFEQNTSLDPIAEAYDLKIESLDGVTKSAGEGLFGNEKLRETAFGNDVLTRGFNSAVVELDDTQAVVMRVRKRHEPRERSLEEVRQQVVDTLTREKARTAIETATIDGLARLEAGESAGQVANVLGAEWQTASRATRSQADVPREVLEKAFALPVDREPVDREPVDREPVDRESVDRQTEDRAVASVDLPDGRALVTVTEVIDGDLEAMTTEEIEGLWRYVKSRSSDLEFTGLFRTVEKSEGVTRADR